MTSNTVSQLAGQRCHLTLRCLNLTPALFSVSYTDSVNTMIASCSIIVIHMFFFLRGVYSTSIGCYVFFGFSPTKTLSGRVNFCNEKLKNSG